MFHSNLGESEVVGIQRGIVFTKSQMKWLEGRAKEYSVSVSEVVRRIVDEKRENGVTAKSSA